MGSVRRSAILTALMAMVFITLITTSTALQGTLDCNVSQPDTTKYWKGTHTINFAWSDTNSDISGTHDANVYVCKTSTLAMSDSNCLKIKDINLMSDTDCSDTDSNIRTGRTCSVSFDVNSIDLNYWIDVNVNDYNVHRGADKLAPDNNIVCSSGFFADNSTPTPPEAYVQPMENGTVKIKWLQDSNSSPLEYSFWRVYYGTLYQETCTNYPNSTSDSNDSTLTETTIKGLQYPKTYYTCLAKFDAANNFSSKQGSVSTGTLGVPQELIQQSQGGTTTTTQQAQAAAQVGAVQAFLGSTMMLGTTAVPMWIIVIAVIGLIYFATRKKK